MTTSAATAGFAGPQPPDDSISLIEILNAVLRNWRAVVILPLIFAVIAGTMALRGKRSYSATASFVPQSGETRSLSGAAALAQQFGVNLGGSTAGQSPQFYEGLLRSTAILRRAVESEYQFAQAGQERKGTLIQYWRLDAVPDPVPAWRRGVDRLRGSVGTSVRRETGVIDLTVTSDQPLMAEQMATRLLALLNDYNLELRQNRAREESKFVSDRLVDVQRELQVAEDALEAFLRSNRDFRNSPELTFRHDHLDRQVMARQEAYATLLSAQEQSRIESMRATPVLNIIDVPAETARPVSRKVALRTLIAFIMGFLLAIAVATVREIARRGKQTGDPQIREFEYLVRGALNDLRHPRQWLGKRDKHVAPGKD